MSATALPLATDRASARAALPLGAALVTGWAAVGLLLAPLATEAFLWWSGLGFTAALLWPLARAWRGGVDPADALWCFLLYFAFGMLLRGLGLLTFVDSPYLRLLGDARSDGFRAWLAWAFFYSALGTAALTAAWRAPGGPRGLERRLAEAPWLRAPWRASRVTVAGVTLLALGLLGNLLRARSLGGFASAAADPLRTGSEYAVGRFWQVALTECAVVGFHVLVLGAMLRRRGVLRVWIGLGLALTLLLYAMSGSKALLIRLWFAPFLFRHFVVKPLRMRTVLLFFLAIALLFPLMYAYSAVGTAGLDAMRGYLETTELPLLKLYTRAYDADSFMRVLQATTEGHGPLLWGRSLTDLFVFFVPRALWAAKPPSFGLQFPLLYMPEVEFGPATYVSSSLPGELFANFHVAGLLLGFLGLGWALRVAYRATRRGGPGAVLLYAYFFLTAVHLVEGSIAAQLEFFLMSAVPALAALAWLTAERAPARAEAA